MLLNVIGILNYLKINSKNFSDVKCSSELSIIKIFTCIYYLIYLVISVILCRNETIILKFGIHTKSLSEISLLNNNNVVRG